MRSNDYRYFGSRPRRCGPSREPREIECWFCRFEVFIVLRAPAIARDTKSDGVVALREFRSFAAVLVFSTADVLPARLRSRVGCARLRAMYIPPLWLFYSLQKFRRGDARCGGKKGKKGNSVSIWMDVSRVIRVFFSAVMNNNPMRRKTIVAGTLRGDGLLPLNSVASRLRT